MAKNYFNRYVWLIETINRSGHISFQDISNAWAYSHVNVTRESRLSQRTFFNHIDAIFDTFGIEIKCDRSLGYYIANSEDLEGDGIRQRLLEALSMSNMLNETKEMRSRILFENVPSSQRWLSVIMDSMRSRKALEITYQGFGKNVPSTFVVHPYCLKLFKQRWYMLAKSVVRDELRIYALDERMIDARLTDEDYKVPARFNAEKFFSDYFGIIVGTDREPQEIVIRVADRQVGYFDSLPLHDSQRKIEKECTPDHSVYKYHLSPTYDFKQELLRYGPDVEVLSPESFREEMHADIKEMLSRYE